MKRESFRKDLFRSISRSKARFLSILIIIAIGVGFFAGINATEPDMIRSADQYYQDKNLADFRIISPLGFQDEDIDLVKKIAAVEKIQEGFSKDLFLKTKEGNTSTIRLYSYDEKDFQNNAGINQFVVQEGRLPKNEGEIVVEAGENVPAGITIGSEVKLSAPGTEDLNDVLHTDTYTVVGKVDSPMYISFERGQTNIGDGSIGFFAYVGVGNFKIEKITDLFIKTKQSKNFSAYSEEYVEHLTPVQDSLKDLGKRAMATEIDKLKNELAHGKSELQEKKQSAEQKLADANQDLVEAKQEILKAEEEINKNEQEYKNTFKDKRSELKRAEAQWQSGEKTYQTNLEKWQHGYDEYQQGKTELNKTKNALDRIYAQLKKNENDLINANAQLDETLAAGEKLKHSIKGLNHLFEQLTKNPPASQSEYIQLIESADFPQELGETLIQFKYSMKNIPVILKEITSLRNDIQKQQDELQTSYQKGLVSYQEGKQRWQSGLADYEQGVRQYDAGLKELSTTKKELDSSKRELDKAKQELEKKKTKLAEGKKALNQAEIEFKREIETGRREIAEKRQEWQTGWETFEQEKADALAEIEKVEIEFTDAEANVNEIPHEWFVNTRAANPGYSGYGDDAERIGAVAKVFPLFFFLVAALVCLTTMTRMVEEERGQIGTLKALGYGTFMIAAKYLVYALTSSLLGALIGLIIGFRLFPVVIMNAYGIMYSIPERLTPIHWNYVIISLVIALMTTVFAALLATLQELKATPATLMQPRAPKPGKRILLERIPFLWSRLSFSHKVTFRNLFRYKRRFYMTVIGISGCTALLITGFGLSDSINDIMRKQFQTIFLYDGQVVLDAKENPSERLNLLLEKEKQISQFMPIYNETIEAVDSDSERTYEVNLMIPENPQDIENYLDLKERKTKGIIDIPNEGAVITEKLSKLLGIEVGDSLQYYNTDNHRFKIEVVAVAENYLSHYLYMSPKYAEKIIGKTIDYNGLMFNVKGLKELDHTAFKERLMSHEEVLNVFFYKEISDTYGETMESLDYVVLVLIIAAAMLAFVVLYNLTNINITERIREIATIKVLGFRDKEVDLYVYRENMILTVFGTMLGLILGIILHRYVINTMEIDSMMFGKQVHLSSYLWSIILTLSFSIMVNYFMHFKLKHVNMVESLKSVE